MPPIFVNQLKQLQDTLPPVPFEDIKAILEKELGRPLEDVRPNYNFPSPPQTCLPPPDPALCTMRCPSPDVRCPI
jgi:hypothetical protein